MSGGGGGGRGGIISSLDRDFKKHIKGLDSSGCASRPSNRIQEKHKEANHCFSKSQGLPGATANIISKDRKERKSLKQTNETRKFASAKAATLSAAVAMGREKKKYNYGVLNIHH